MKRTDMKLTKYRNDLPIILSESIGFQDLQDWKEIPKVNHCVSSCRALRHGHPVFAWTLPVKRLVTGLEQFFHLEQHDGWKFIMLNKNLSSCNFHQFFLILPQITKSHSHNAVRITRTNAQNAGCFSCLSFLKHSFDYVIPQYEHFQWLPHC